MSTPTPESSTIIFSADPKLIGVTFNVFTGVVGTFRVFGHSLLQFSDFKMEFKAGTADEPRIVAAEVDPSSLRVVDRVDWKRKAPKESPPNAWDKTMIKKNALESVLEVEKHPDAIRFNVKEQTKDHVLGDLTLHGVTAPVKCTRRSTDYYHIAECPLLQKDFGIAPYGFGENNFSVDPEVMVQVKIPKPVMQALAQEMTAANSKRRGWF